MKASFPIILAICLIGTASPAAFITIPGLYNTGVDDEGNVLPIGSSEIHYSVHGASDDAYIVPEVFHSPGSRAWVTAPAGSAWIGPNTTSSTWPTDPTGLYYYTLQITFTIAVINPSLVQIAGLWAADDTSEIWVNGIFSGFAKSGWDTFSRLDPFLLQGFVLGENSIEFRVQNIDQTQYPDGNPSGLLVAGLTAVDDGSLELPTPPGVVPEPSTYLAGALLILPLGTQLIRRLRRRV